MSTGKATAAKTAGKQRGRPFKKGLSGNPKGRPHGSRSQTALRVDELLEKEVDAVVAAVIKGAKNGDSTAMRLVLERIAPLRKGRPVQMDMPTLEQAADLPKALGTLLQEIGAGTITPEEGATIAGVIEAKCKALQTLDLEERISALEQRSGKQ